MLKFVTSHSATSSSNNSINKESYENAYSNSDIIHTACGLIYDPKLKIIAIKTKNGLLKINCNNLDKNRKILDKLFKKNQKKFHKEASSLNSSCNDSVISSSNSSTSSYNGENELELSSDNEEINKFNIQNNKQTIDLNKSILSTTESTVSSTSSTNSSHQSVLLSNQVSKPATISTTAQKLLLPKDFLENYDCYTRQRSVQTMVKIYTKVLCSEIEYKTLSITKETTSKKVISILLNKFKMKNRDPNLFFLTMEICIKKAGMPFRSVMVLNDESCPAQLKAAYPNDEIKFSLMTKYGRLVKVYDSCLMKGSLYKSIIIAENTTVSELIQLMLNCYNLVKDKFENYSLFVVNKLGAYKLNENQLPLQVQDEWKLNDENIFQLRRNNEINLTNFSNKPNIIRKVSNSPDTTKNCISSQEFQNYFYI